MKKLLIILLMLFPLAAESATITATKAGNWSDTSVWDLGRIPAAGDDVALAGYDIVWDTSITRIPASGTLASITSPGTGHITLDLSDAAFHGGASIYSTKIQAGTKIASDKGILTVTGTTDHVLTINVGTTPNGLIGGSESESYGCHSSTTGTINVIGDILSGAGSYRIGMAFWGNGSLNVTGSIYGGKGNAVSLATTGASAFTGNITGGTANTANGVYVTGSGTISVNGILTGGTATQYSYALYNHSGTNVTFSSNTKLIYGTASAAYTGKAAAWQPAASSYMKQYVGTGFGQEANTEFKIPQTTGSAQ